MAVYERNYVRYSGPVTPERTRYLILPRYAYEAVFKSRLFVGFLALCFGPPFVGLLIIYLYHNASALQLLGLTPEKLAEMFPIGNKFFYNGLWMQGGLGFLLAFFVGPSLVAPDLRNNGLPLYLSRPFSRTEYVLGKMSVLVILLSAITWVPGMLLFLLQGYLEGAGWLARNWRLGFAVFLGSWVWILYISLFALAISAWMKWKPVARITMALLFFVLLGFGAALFGILDTPWGLLISPWNVIDSVWNSLFGLPPGNFTPPAGPSWLVLAGGCAIFLWLLSRRIRAYEVVR
jgi:ABC-2 type transport system permease protein